MLSMCANPGCTSKFRYLHQGRVFFVESHRHEDFSPRVNFVGYVDGMQYAWLCDECSTKYEVVLDKDERIQVRPPFRLSGVIASVGVSIGIKLLAVAGDIYDKVA